MTARAVLVDSHVLIDLLGPDSPVRRWSVDALEREGETSPLRIEELDAALPADVFHREPRPWPGGFLAARAHMEYRRRGGARSAVLSDFVIGAHAAVGGMALLTRDPARYRSYFPTVEVVAPG